MHTNPVKDISFYAYINKFYWIFWTVFLAKQLESGKSVTCTTVLHRFYIKGANIMMVTYVLPPTTQISSTKTGEVQCIPSMAMTPPTNFFSINVNFGLWLGIEKFLPKNAETQSLDVLLFGEPVHQQHHPHNVAVAVCQWQTRYHTSFVRSQIGGGTKTSWLDQARKTTSLGLGKQPSDFLICGCSYLLWPLDVTT